MTPLIPCMIPFSLICARLGRLDEPLPPSPECRGMLNPLEDVVVVSLAAVVSHRLRIWITDPSDFEEPSKNCGAVLALEVNLPQQHAGSWDYRGLRRDFHHRRSAKLGVH